MKWRTSRRSSNVEDRRSVGRGPMIAGGGVGLIVMALVAAYFGVDPTAVLKQGMQQRGQANTQTHQPSAAENELADFISVVLADTEDTWNALFQQQGAQYREPSLVLFTGAVQSACGQAQAAMGPFYCPGDQKLYIDLSFYRDLKQRHNAPGDFAQAYVVAHEVGHHVQTLMGISAQVQNQQQRLRRAQANELSVRQELQADCLAGIWAHHAHRSRQILQQGDIEEALNAASSIGDDRLQQQSRGYAVPESFTHGTSQQRVRWFKQGLTSGQLKSCDTFNSARL